MNDVLRAVGEYSGIVYEPWTPESRYSLSTHSFVEDKQIYCEVTTNVVEYALHGAKKFVPCTYIFRKDGQSEQVIDPAICYSTLQRYYKTPDMRKVKFFGEYLEMNERGTYVSSARPLVGYNERYDNSEQKMWVYDLNSAYAWAMCQPIPDTSGEHREDDIIREGEIGFMLDDECTMVTKKGSYADVIFPLIPSPYKDFAQKYYNIKKTTKDKAEKARAKQMLVYAVGYLQRHNPFIRSRIVSQCNRYIKRLINDDTAMWNTDAIYSLVPRTDLEIGDNLGQFKLEHDGEIIRHRGCNYQVVGKSVTYRGVSKAWFTDGEWNLLTDPIPCRGNIYYLNRETFRIEEEEYEI